MQLGDFDHRNPQTLSEMRAMHSSLRRYVNESRAVFTEFVAPNMPLVHICDDHDFGANNSDKNFPGRTSSLQAFDDYYPTVDRPNTNGNCPRL